MKIFAKEADMLFKRKKRKDNQSDCSAKLKLSPHMTMNLDCSDHQTNIMLIGNTGSGMRVWIQANIADSMTNCVIVGDPAEYSDALEILTQRGFYIHHLDLSSTPEHIDDMLHELSGKDKQALFMEVSQTGEKYLKQAGLHTWIVLSALIDIARLPDQHIQFYIDPVISGYIPQWEYILPMVRRANTGICICFTKLPDKVNEIACNCPAILYLGHSDDLVNTWISSTFPDIPFKAGESFETMDQNDMLILMDGKTVRSKKMSLHL